MKPDGFDLAWTCREHAGGRCTTWCEHWSNVYPTEFDRVPFSLTECQVCFALTQSHADHMRWHWSQGWRPEGGAS